ncbi:MAG TPA: HTTM domain-containing protein [Polyangiaceae bacterium]|jgi:hypothetical protein|nr:HTTM domain-containing protein [Polyangiaceae bacterium]
MSAPSRESGAPSDPAPPRADERIRVSFPARKTPAIRASRGWTAGKRLSDVVGLDLRSIGLLRIGIAACLLIDLAGRATDLEAHYTDAGVFPRAPAIETADAWHISLHLANGQSTFQAILFAMAAFCAICLLVGVQTRLAAIASWVFIVSLQNRNFIILNGADVLLRMMLFWSLFLPLGARFSVDRLRSTSRPAAETNWIVTPGTVFYALQFMLVYIFAGLIKSEIPAWREGTGLAYALRSPEFVEPLGLAFVENVTAMRILNGFVIYGELFGSFLLLLPVWTAATRIALVLGFSALHLLIAATMSVGMFPLVAIVAVCVFLPSPFWDHASRIVNQRAPFWRRGVDRLSSWLRPPIRARLDPLPERSPAVVRRWGTAFFGAGCITLVLLCNISTFRPLPFLVPEKLQWITPLLRLEQRWDMFASPLTAGGWFVIPARLTSGAEVDLATQKPSVSWDEPPLVADTYANARWKKYFMNISIPPYSHHRLLFGRYLCRSWNETHPGAQSLEAFKIYFMRQAVEPWRPAYPAQKQMLWQHECRDGLLQKWGSLL